MSRRSVLILACVSACSVSVRPPAAELSSAPRNSPAVVDSGPRPHAKPGIDLSGPWTTGSTNEPAGPELELHVQCNYSPSMWLIDQHGDNVRAWVIPASYAQGIAAPQEEFPRAASGRMAGVDVALTNDDARYVLRYDEVSKHLRGTLNGSPFWAVRLKLLPEESCIGVP